MPGPSAALVIVSPCCPVCEGEDIRPAVQSFMKTNPTVEEMRDTPVRCVDCSWVGPSGSIRILIGDHPQRRSGRWGHG